MLGLYINWLLDLTTSNDYDNDIWIFFANCAIFYWRDRVVVIAYLSKSFEENLFLKWLMTTTLSRQYEMMPGISVKNDKLLVVKPKFR